MRHQTITSRDEGHGAVGSCTDDISLTLLFGAQMVAVKKIPIDDRERLGQGIHELEQLKNNHIRIKTPDQIVDSSLGVDPVSAFTPGTVRCSGYVDAWMVRFRGEPQLSRG